MAGRREGQNYQPMGPRMQEVECRGQPKASPQPRLPPLLPPRSGPAPPALTDLPWGPDCPHPQDSSCSGSLPTLRDPLSSSETHPTRLRLLSLPHLRDSLPPGAQAAPLAPTQTPPLRVSSPGPRLFPALWAHLILLLGTLGSGSLPRSHTCYPRFVGSCGLHGQPQSASLWHMI